MPKNAKEKLKTLYLMDYLLEHTDEQHPTTVQALIDFLNCEHNITAERKSIYRDLKLLGPKPVLNEDYSDFYDEEDAEEDDSYGLDIVSKNGKYYIGKRYFSLQEVKLLIDFIESSNSIPQAIADKLIKKIKTLVSEHDRAKLVRHVDVRNQVKHLNEQFQQNADKVFEAINTGKTLRFQYFGYNVKKEKELRHGGKTYLVSPYSLVWVDQNYYMLSYNHEAKQIRTYRVDRMTRVTLAKNPREGSKAYQNLIGGNLPGYINKVFHMYSGEMKIVQMRFHKSLVDTVIDRFGENVMLHPDSDDHFTVSTEVSISPQFYGWLAGFGGYAELLAPPDEREKMAQHLHSAVALY